MDKRESIIYFKVHALKSMWKKPFINRRIRTNPNPNPWTHFTVVYRTSDVIMYLMTVCGSIVKLIKMCFVAFVVVFLFRCLLCAGCTVELRLFREGWTGRRFETGWVCDLTFFTWPRGNESDPSFPSSCVSVSCSTLTQQCQPSAQCLAPSLASSQQADALSAQPERMMETDIFWEASYITETADSRQTIKSDNKACERHYIMWRFKRGFYNED